MVELSCRWSDGAVYIIIGEEQQLAACTKAILTSIIDKCHALHEVADKKELIVFQMNMFVFGSYPIPFQHRQCIVEMVFHFQHKFFMPNCECCPTEMLRG